MVARSGAEGFVSRLATAWASQTELAPIGEEREVFMAARRAATVAAVQRLFPDATDTHDTSGEPFAEHSASSV